MFCVNKAVLYISMHSIVKMRLPPLLHSSFQSTSTSKFHGCLPEYTSQTVDIYNRWTVIRICSLYIHTYNVKYFVAISCKMFCGSIGEREFGKLISSYKASNLSCNIPILPDTETFKSSPYVTDSWVSKSHMSILTYVSFMYFTSVSHRKSRTFYANLYYVTIVILTRI